MMMNKARNKSYIPARRWGKMCAKCAFKMFLKIMSP
jgi:hypothetical protein